jgi:CHASE1-domain containing sensor protein
VVLLGLARVAKAWVPLTLIVAIDVALSIYASIVSARFGEARARAEFERQAIGEIAALKISIDAALGAVTSLAALYEARGTVERGEFKRFAETILVSAASIQALEWTRVVPHDQRAVAEEQLAREFGSGVHIMQRDHARLTVAGERERYVPVTYITPMQGNELALAYDLTSEETRRAAVEQAESTGLPVASGRIEPVQQANEYSFLLFRPIFAAAEQPGRMAGLVLGVFRIRDIVAMAMAGREGNHTRLLLLDRSAPKADQVLYPRDPGGGLADLLAIPGVSADVAIGGRVWSIVVVPAGREGVPGRRESRVVLAGSLVLTGNIALYVLLIMRRQWAIEREVRIRTQEAKAAIDHLRQGLCRFDANGRLLVAKGLSGISRVIFFIANSYRVVPFAMEGVAYDVDLGHFLISHRNAFPVDVGVEFTLHGQSGFSGRGADQIDDDAIADERLGRQFMLMNENSRCSILFHLLVPGGG